MQPPPPSTSVTRAFLAGWMEDAERLVVMVQSADQLAVELALGGSATGDRIAAALLAELRPFAVRLVCRRGEAGLVARASLKAMADRLAMALDAARAWPGPARTQLSPVRALVARLRLLAEN